MTSPPSDDLRRRAEQATAGIALQREIADKFLIWRDTPASGNPAADQRLRDEAAAGSRRILDMP